jgi:hypothetical protein
MELNFTIEQLKKHPRFICLSSQQKKSILGMVNTNREGFCRFLEKRRIVKIVYYKHPVQSLVQIID